MEKDTSIFLKLTDQHKGIIYKVANSYCKNEEDRKDLIQEIIVQLWKAFPKYNGQSQYTTWMYRIALNIAISFYRKGARRREISIPIREDAIHFEPEDESGEKEANIQLLQQFIAALNKFDRALMLLYIDEKSHREMSEILGISETNVATKIGRIKNKLKQRFADV